MVKQTKPEIAPKAPPAPPAKAEPLKTPVDIYYLLMSSGKFDFVIHQQSCKQYKLQKSKSQYKGLDDYGLTGVVNQREVIMEVWDDQIRETWNEDEDLKDKDYGTATWGWLQKHGYVDSVQFHTCLAGLPQQAKNAAKGPNARKLAKTTLATLVAEAAGEVVRILSEENLADPTTPDLAAVLAGYADQAAIAQCVAQWLHGMPVDRKRFLAVLPRPDRSDWRQELDEANSAPAEEAEEDTPEQEEGEEDQENGEVEVDEDATEE